MKNDGLANCQTNNKIYFCFNFKTKMPTVTRTLSSLRPIAGPFHSTAYGVSDLMTGLNSTSSPSLTAKSDREFTNRGRPSGRSVMHIASDRDWGEILGGEGIRYFSSCTGFTWRNIRRKNRG